MRQKNETGAVVVAAGTGSRMGGGLPKQFRKLDGKPMYLRSLAPFVADEAVSRIVLVVDDAHVDAVREELAQAAPRVTVATGGATRAESVRNGLAALPSDVRYVLVHDGARPYVTPEVIGRVGDAMFRTGAAIPCGIRFAALTGSAAVSADSPFRVCAFDPVLSAAISAAICAGRSAPCGTATEPSASAVSR